MSEKAKQFGSGAIISAMVIFTVTGVFGWIGVTTAEVPALKAQAQAEFKHLNYNLNELKRTAQETNKQLKAYTEFHAINLSRITESLIGNKYKLMQLEEDCENNKVEISKCIQMNDSIGIKNESN